jgi:hypothetical protein
VVERGRAMQNLMQERQLAESGELRKGSNMGKGQMVTADYVLTPDAVFSSKDSGGIGGALGGLGVFGAVQVWWLLASNSSQYKPACCWLTRAPRCNWLRQRIPPKKPTGVSAVCW